MLEDFSPISDETLSNLMADIERRAKQRPMVMVNGKRLRNPSFAIATHPKVDLRDYLFHPEHCPHYISITKINGRIVGQITAQSLSYRKSSRALIEYQFEE